MEVLNNSPLANKEDSILHYNTNEKTHVGTEEMHSYKEKHKN